MSLSNKLLQYIYAGFPLLYLNTFEGSKGDRLVSQAARDTARTEVLVWDGTGALCSTSADGISVSLETGLQGALDLFLRDYRRKVLVLKDIHAFMADPVVLALLRDIAVRISLDADADATVVLMSPVLDIPPELEKYITVLDMDYPDSQEIQAAVRAFTERYDIGITADLLHEMGVAFKGLSELEIENILALAYAEDGELTRKILGLIFEQKKQMIRKAGILEMIPLKEGMEDVGGLEHLKEWLRRKAKVFKDMDRACAFGVDIPKGVLITGVPGCGKSLSTKATVKLLEVPLLRLDMGRLLGKYVGESERNLRKAIQLAEAISPCVLWVDELEKAFAGIGGDGGGAEVTTRLFGSFLTWLQEKSSPVFVVATANDVTKLPPELLRKGRFDETFYVSLPNDTERKKVLEIHIRKRRPGDLNGIDLDKLVSETKGYSGTDLEGVVREGVENVFADGRAALSTQDILTAIHNTHPLSEIMKESLKKLDEEYQTRKFKNASR